MGYFFSQELQEYVYYSNDPATGSDLKTAHREYRESQLSEAWYRRAAYFVHEKEAGAGDYAREYHQAALWPVEGQEDVYALIADGQVVQLPVDFMRDPRENFGAHGTLALIVPGEEAELPEGVRRVTANHDFYFNLFNPTEDGYLKFTGGLIPELLEQETPPTIFVIFNSGASYTATASADAPVYTPGMELPQPEAPSADSSTDTASSFFGGSLVLPIVLVAVLAAAIVAVVLVRKKKH